jgi:hypothetical protein
MPLLKPAGDATTIHRAIPVLENEKFSSRGGKPHLDYGKIALGLRKTPTICKFFRFLLSQLKYERDNS